MKTNFGMIKLGMGMMLLAAVTVVALAPTVAADQQVNTYQGGSCNQSNSGTVTVNVNVVNNYSCNDADNNTVYACDNDAQQYAGAYGGGWYWNPSSGGARASATADGSCQQPG